MAVTSATSAEIVAVSSIGSYDIYKTHINPKASDKQILKVDHILIIACEPLWPREVYLN